MEACCNEVSDKCVLQISKVLEKRVAGTVGNALQRSSKKF